MSRKTSRKCKFRNQTYYRDRKNSHLSEIYHQGTRICPRYTA